MEAFSVFIQHWMKEENEIKARIGQEALRLRRNVACETILLNRRIVSALKVIVSALMEVMEEGLDANNNNAEEFDELFALANRLAVDVVVNHEIFGVCDKCEAGLVRFRVDDNGLDMSAVCDHCDEIHLYLYNIFIGI